MTDETLSGATDPHVGRADGATTVWRALLYARLAGQPEPVVVFSDSVRSAASLWAGLRAWTSTFRAIGVGTGDRVVSVLPSGEALLQLALACLWESVGLALADEVADGPGAEAECDALLAQQDARCLIDRVVRGSHVLTPAAGGWPLPPEAGWHPRDADTRGADRGPPGLSGTSKPLFPSTGRTAAAHRRWAHGAFANARVVTLCRWQEPRSLWRGVILPLLEADELFVPRDPTDAAFLCQLLAEQPVTHAVVDATTPREIRARLREYGVPLITLPADSHRRARFAITPPQPTVAPSVRPDPKAD